MWTREKVRVFIEDNSSRGGMFFDYFIQCLVIVSMITFSIETLPDNTKNTKQFIAATFLVLILGVGVVTVPAGLIATALTKARKIQDEKISNEIDTELRRMKGPS